MTALGRVALLAALATATVAAGPATMTAQDSARDTARVSADTAGPSPALPVAELAAPGISLDLARHRAATLDDIRYDVAIRIPAGPDADVTGEVTIGFDRAGDRPLIIDFGDPSRVRSVAVDGREVAYEAVNNHVVVPGGALSDGRGSVTLTFAAGDGPLNRRDDFLYTLFVPDRAHEAIPLFDQPDLKARFRLRLTVPAGWTAVANGAEEARATIGDEVVYEFAKTQPLPTYLFAFAAGEFEVEEAERDGRTIRLIHRETDEENVARNREAIFDLHGTALAWLEDYTGIPYPFGKFDVVAIPSFQYNGMEHPGAILYRATSLFLDESATRNQELGRASVIAHETAHMWFGDLVTMEWFDDVWMKEVFANFMAAKIVNPSFPELDHDLRFLLAHYPAAYDVDRTAGANPIRQPLDNLDDAGSLYGAIIYQKAPIVMRQLERLTGEDAFRTALRRYLDANRFGNAGWPALVAELDAVADFDVAAWSQVWIEEAGRPEILIDRGKVGDVGDVGDVGVRAGDGGSGVATFQLTPQDPAGRGRVWAQRTVVGRVAETNSNHPEPREKTEGAGGDERSAADSEAVTLAGEPVSVEIEAGRYDAILPNAEGLGYGLFRLDPASAHRLLENLPWVARPLERAVGWLDLWEMMLAGDVEAERLLDLGMRVVAREEDELVAQQVLGDLRELYWRFVDGAVRARRAEEVEGVLWDRVLAVEGASAKAAYFNAWRSVASSPGAVARMRAIWSGELEIEGLPLSERDRSSLALQLAVRGVGDAEAILDAQEADIENLDRRERFAFVRRAASVDPVTRRAFAESLDRVENRAREEWVVTALGLLHHPLRADESLELVRPGLELLLEVQETGDIFFPTRWVAAILGGHSSAEAAEIVSEFIAENSEYPERLLGKLLQAADPLFRAVRD